MTKLLAPVLALVALAAAASAALAGHIPGQPCTGCTSHAHWPTIDGALRKANGTAATFTGTERNDQLMGHHASDVLDGGAGSDVLWGDWDPSGQPTTQRDRITGGGGTDFIYGSHGHNTIRAGAGNDVISVHYGRGVVDCGAGRDLYHVARSRKRAYRFRNCEEVDFRSESQRGGPMAPLD